MKRTMKLKLLFLALLCTVAQGAWAQVSVWDGKSKEPPVPVGWPVYAIKNAAQFAWLIDRPSDYMSGKIYYRLDTDLDMGDQTWTPIGYINGEAQGFYSHLLGQGHTIRINISGATKNYQGLFARIGFEGSVDNLHVIGKISCSKSRLVGGIAGENDGGSISNCWVSADVSSDWREAASAYTAKVGGIVGENNHGTIEYCCVTGDVTNNDADVGGIAGYNSSRNGGAIIRHCTFYGTRNSTHSQDNKYVGDQDSTMENMYDSFNQDEYDAAGNRGMYRKAIKYTYDVAVKTKGQGSVRTWAANEYDVPGTRAGETFSINVTSGTVHSVTITDADGDNVSLQGHANDWSSFWFVMPKNNVTATVVFESKWPGCTSGTGESGDPYIIRSASDWNEFAQSVYFGNTHSGKYVKLANNISVTTMVGDSESNSFQGTFDGDGKTLTLNLNERYRAIAPFRYVKDATIKSLKTAGNVTGNYTSNSDAMDLSGIVGWAYGTTTIQNCVSSVAITSNRPADVDAGGFVAHVNGGQTIELKGCVFNGSITYSNASGNEGGGLIGWLRTDATATVKDCLFAPTAISISNTNAHYTLTGGTATAAAAATITGCYYTQVLGTAQGIQAIFNTSASSNLGSLVEDYGMVKAYEKGLFFDGKYYFAPATIDGTGTEDDPYLISNTDQWGTFAAYVNNGTNNYSGKFVQLTADISVSEMVGNREANSFQGTFIGNNHTLTFTKGTSESAFNEQCCAPFRHIKGATIRDLKTAGVIYTSQKFASGLISFSYGTTTIMNCHVGTDIYSRVGGDGTHGAFVAFPAGPVNITGCSFNGRLLTSTGTHSCGGFVAWHNAKTITVTNSLYAPDCSIPSGWTAIDNGATFVRGGEPTITGCYYTETMGEAQGKKAAARATTPDNLGGLVKDYGMLKAYESGIFFDGKYYVDASKIGLDGDTDNGSAISDLDGATVDVTLTDCTFYKDGKWNTVCLPFNLTLAGSPLDGAVARPLTGASISGSTLNLSFGDAVTELKAGTPYIIKWVGGGNIVNPKFNGVTIDATDRSFDNGAKGDERVRFIGVYKSIAFDGEDKSVLLLGSANTLYHPVSGAGVGALRAYFKIGDSATKATISVDGFVLTIK